MAIEPNVTRLAKTHTTEKCLRIVLLTKQNINEKIVYFMINNIKYNIILSIIFLNFCCMHMLIVFSNNDRICNKLLKQIKIMFRLVLQRNKDS